jgi:hypothetical protein
MSDPNPADDDGRTHYYGDGCDDDHGRADFEYGDFNVDDYPTVDVTGHHHVLVLVDEPFVIVNNDVRSDDKLVYDDEYDHLIDRAVDYYNNHDPAR